MRSEAQIARFGNAGVEFPRVYVRIPKPVSTEIGNGCRSNERRSTAGALHFMVHLSRGRLSSYNLVAVYITRPSWDTRGN